MSDTLPERAPDGASPAPAPKKSTTRKATAPATATDGATPKPRKAPVRKKKLEPVVDSPALDEVKEAPVRKKRTVKKVVKAVTKAESKGASLDGSSASMPDVILSSAATSTPTPVSVTTENASVPTDPIISGGVKKAIVRRVSIRREKPKLVPKSENELPPKEEKPKNPAEVLQTIKFVHEKAPERVSGEEGSDSERFQVRRKFQKNPNNPNNSNNPNQNTRYQKNFNRPYNNNGNNNGNGGQGGRQGWQGGQGRQGGQGGGQGNYQNGQNGQNGRRNDNFKSRRENFRDARTQNQDNPAPSGPIQFGPPEEVNGLLELTFKGFGFLRTQESGFEQAHDAVYVPIDMVRNYGLRHAVWIHGLACRHDRGIQLTEIKEVNGLPVEEARNLPHFDELKAVNPNKRISFETSSDRYTTRTLDLVAPVGRGQRGLIVSPPRAGKTTFLQHIAEAVAEKYEDSLHLMILLIDERPEEVTEFKRTIKGAEIYASSNDGKVRDHCRLAELCIDRAKRLVEAGKHVFLLVDSITRLSRAYNNADQGSGRTMSGGIDARALEMPRRLFAAARNTRNAGSLTILATALVETNSRMDDLIFQEFKGTGNMELILSRRIAEQYIYPAVDILKSGTRREELILPENWLNKIHLIRRALAGHKPIEAMERFLFFLKKYPSNVQMLLDLKQRI
ncbi:MAG: transcription termination factor Rho [Akkermansia sp.]